MHIYLGLLGKQRKLRVISKESAADINKLILGGLKQLWKVDCKKKKDAISKVKSYCKGDEIEGVELLYGKNITARLQTKKKRETPTPEERACVLQAALDIIEKRKQRKLQQAKALKKAKKKKKNSG